MPSVLQGDFSELLGQSEREYRKEKFRIASFSEYTGSESILAFARSGFFFKARHKVIECFCCHKTYNVRLRQLREVLPNDNEAHNPNCKWRHSEENIPSYNRTIDLRQERIISELTERPDEIRSRRQRSESPNLNAEKIDRVIYNAPESLEMAPTGDCPCQECVSSAESVPCCLYVREQEKITVSRAGLAKLAKERVEQTGIASPQYARKERRMESFDTHPGWSSTKLPSASDLTEAGFFYTGQGDSVQCFYCEGSLRNWDPRSIPWREHARWFPWCPFLRQQKGDEFIHHVLKITKKIRDGHDDRQQVIKSDVVLNAIQMGHTPGRISLEIQDFFCETGSYPGLDALIGRLESE